MIRNDNVVTLKLLERYINYKKYNKTMKEITTIRLLKETKKELDKYGNKGESYDEIIFKLMKGGLNE